MRDRHAVVIERILQGTRMIYQISKMLQIVSQVMTKSLTSEERWGVLGLINGGATHPFKLVFGGEDNSLVTSVLEPIRIRLRCFAKRPNRWGR